MTNRKPASATQPGRGIRKIVDLFNDLPELLDKADKYTLSQKLSPAEMEELDKTDFIGMTEDDIAEERQE